MMKFVFVLVLSIVIHKFRRVNDRLIGTHILSAKLISLASTNDLEILASCSTIVKLTAGVVLLIHLHFELLEFLRAQLHRGLLNTHVVFTAKQITKLPSLKINYNN